MVKKWTVLLLTLFVGTSLYPAASRWGGFARPLARWFSTNPTPPPLPPTTPDAPVPNIPNNQPLAPEVVTYTPPVRTTDHTRLRSVRDIITESRIRQGLPVTPTAPITVPEVEHAVPINIEDINLSAIDPEILNQVIVPSAEEGVRNWLPEQDVSSAGGSYLSPEEQTSLHERFAAVREDQPQGLWNILSTEKITDEKTPIVEDPDANADLANYIIPFSMFGDDDEPVEIERPLTPTRRPLLSEQEPTDLIVKEPAPVMPYAEQATAITPVTELATEIIPYESPSTELVPFDSPAAVEQFSNRPEVFTRPTEIKAELNAPRTILDATQHSDGVWRVTPEQPTAYTSAKELVPMHTQTDLIPVQQHDRVVINVDQNELATLLQHAMRANTTYSRGQATTAEMANFLATYLEETSGQSSALVPYTKKNNELIPFKEQTNALVPTGTKTRTSTLTVNRDDLERLLDTVLDPYGRTTPEQAAQLLAPEFERVLEQFCNQTAVTPAAHQQQSTPLRIAASDAPAQLALPAPEPQEQTALVVVPEAETEPSLLDKAKALGDKIKSIGSRPDIQQALVTAGAGAASINQRTRLLARRLAQQGNRVFTAVARRQPAAPKALMPPKPKMVPARIKVLQKPQPALKREVNAPIKVMPKRTVKAPTREVDAHVRVTPRQPVREVPAQVKITRKPQPGSKPRAVDAPVRITPRNQIAPKPAKQNSFNSRAAQPRNIVQPIEPVAPRNTVRNARDRLAKPRPAAPRIVEPPVIPRGTVNRAQRRVIDLVKERDGVYRAPKPARTNAPEGTVNNARARLIEPREVAPRPAEQNAIIPRNTVNNALIRIRQPRPEAPRPARANVPEGTVNNARARLIEPREVAPRPTGQNAIIPRNTVSNALVRIRQPRPEAPRPARANVPEGTVKNARARIAEAETNALRQARARAARDAEIRDVIREREARRRPDHVAPRPAQPRPTVRPARPRVVREAEDNALREARARAARRNELRDVIREREARLSRDAAARRAAAERPPARPAPRAGQAVAQPIERVRRLIRDAEEAIRRAARRTWERLRPGARPRVAPRPARAGARRTATPPRIVPRRAPHPGILERARDAVDATLRHVRPTPPPIVPRRLPAADDTPVIAPIPAPRAFPPLATPLPPARTLTLDEPIDELEEALEEEVNENPIEYDGEELIDEDQEEDDTPGVASKPKEEKEEKPVITAPTKAPVNSPTNAPAPPSEKSLGTRTSLPASQTFGEAYTGFTPLVDDIEAWLRKTPPPKVISTLTTGAPDTKAASKAHGFIPLDRPINKDQRRMFTQDNTQQTNRSTTTATGTPLEQPKEKSSNNWLSKIWETIKSVGKKIANVARPLMFWL